MGKPESPIEVLFFEAFVRWAETSGGQMKEVGGGWELRQDGTLVCIIPRAEVGPYRADFVVLVVRGMEMRVLAVELDGHEFHEKTKEQAAKDKRRDRYFMRSGLGPVRFTGSEVFKDADACVGETMASLLTQPILYPPKGVE